MKLRIFQLDAGMPAPFSVHLGRKQWHRPVKHRREWAGFLSSKEDSADAHETKTQSGWPKSGANTAKVRTTNKRYASRDCGYIPELNLIRVPFNTRDRIDGNHQTEEEYISARVSHMGFKA